MLTEAIRQQILVVFYSTGESWLGESVNWKTLTLNVPVQVSISVPPVGSLGLNQRTAGATDQCDVALCWSLSNVHIC